MKIEKIKCIHLADYRTNDKLCSAIELLKISIDKYNLDKYFEEQIFKCEEDEKLIKDIELLEKLSCFKATFRKVQIDLNTLIKDMED